MRLLLAAATDWRTLLWLGAGVLAAAVLANPFPALMGLAVYIWAVQRLVGSPAFAAAGDAARTAQALADRYRQLQVLVDQVNQLFAKPGPSQPGPTQPERSGFSRARDVITAAREIYQEWLAQREQHAAKTPVVDQAVQMATLYLKVLRSYHTVYAGKQAVDLMDVRVRLDRNRLRLEQTADLEARQDLARAIEMDERVLAFTADESTEKERYQAKLAAIESAMDMLRRQIFDPDVDEDVQRLQDLLVEAEAMDTALDEVQHRCGTRVRN